MTSRELQETDLSCQPVRLSHPLTNERNEWLPRIHSHGSLASDRERFLLDVLVLSLKLGDSQRWNQIAGVPAQPLDAHLPNEVQGAVVHDSLGPDALDVDRLVLIGIREITVIIDMPSLSLSSDVCSTRLRLRVGLGRAAVWCASGVAAGAVRGQGAVGASLAGPDRALVACGSWHLSWLNEVSPLARTQYAVSCATVRYRGDRTFLSRIVVIHEKTLSDGCPASDWQSKQVPLFSPLACLHLGSYLQ